MQKTTHAYRQAVALIVKDHTKYGNKKEVLRGTYRIEDVLEVVAAAKTRYHEASRHNSARRWLSSFSARVVYYGQILDVLSQHHPEYVSLAWGTMKFCFVLVLNHEEMVTELAKAMADIADILPRVELQFDMFESESIMRVAVEELYAGIINFLLRALNWYEYSPFRRLLKSFTVPYKLRFEDLKNQIEKRARRVETIAETLSQVRLMHMHDILQKVSAAQKDTQQLILQSAFSLQKVESLLEELKTLAISNHSASMSRFTFIDQNTHQIQIGMILSATKRTPLASSVESLRYCQAVNRRRQRQYSMDHSHLVGPFQGWATSAISTFMVIEGSAPKRFQTKDLATNLVSLLNAAKKPTIWGLAHETTSHPNEETSVHVLKHMVTQVIQLNEAHATRRVSENLNIARIERASTETDWLSILHDVLVGLREIFIVIDMEVFGTDMSDDSCSVLFLRSLEILLSSVSDTVVRLVIFSFRKPLIRSIRSISNQASIVPLENELVVTMSKKAMKRNSKSSRKRGLKFSFNEGS